MNRCGQRTGFLTLTMCDDVAAAFCTRCGKPVCANHLHTTSTGPCCPDCAVVGLDPDEAHRRGLDPYYHRWYSTHDTYTTGYSSSDYDNFEAGGGEMAGGGASDEWDDAADTGDSESGSDSGSDGAAFQDS